MTQAEFNKITKSPEYTEVIEKRIKAMGDTLYNFYSAGNPKKKDVEFLVNQNINFYKQGYKPDERQNIQNY